MTREELQNALNDLLAGLPSDGWTRKEWTHRIKKKLVSLGHSQELKTCATGVCEASWPEEWLYDVVWLKATDKFEVEDVVLVAEIEWGDTGDVWDDFQKLLQARARFRVMIFDHKGELQNKLIQQIKKFEQSQTGDRYLFASYADRKFTVKEHVY